MLNYVVPAAELDAKVDWLIGRIVDKSPTAIRRGKYAMRAIAAMSFDESIAYTESQIALLAHDRRRQGRPQGLRRKAQAGLAGTIGSKHLRPSSPNVCGAERGSRRRVSIYWIPAFGMTLSR